MKDELEMLRINGDFDRAGACVSVSKQPQRVVTHQTAFSPQGTCDGLWSDLITDGRLDSPAGRRRRFQAPFSIFGCGGGRRSFLLAPL